MMLKRKVLTSREEIDKEHPNLKVSEEELAYAQKSIVAILSALANFYNQQDTNSELYELMDNQLFKNQILNNPEYKDQIISTLEKIKSNTELSRKDLAGIDKFVSILDNEAAVLYRKLRIDRR
ncbi:MAG: hypothetical protein U0U70_14305 [Chitinophagaceae bacterium]